MKIFVDFDDVLFNAKKFKKDLISIFRKHGVDKDKFENSYYTYPRKNSDAERFYYPNDQIRRLKKNYDLDTKKLEKEISSLMVNLDNYVFSDAHSFLRNFEKRDLFLMTYGHQKFQKEKIKGAKIEKYFKNITVSCSDKPQEVLKLSKKFHFEPEESIFLIDDKAEYLERIGKEAKRIKTFHMRRPQGRYSTLECKHADYEVKNLRQVQKIINSL